MQKKDYMEELNAALCAKPKKLDNLEPPPFKVRCERCGRVIENSYGSTAMAINDIDAFFEYYGDVPVRTTALLCRSCNGYLESCTDSQSHKRAMLEAFCEFPKDVEKTVRGEFEEKDLLWIFERMQFVLRGHAKGEHLTHDNCVRDIFTDGGYKCPIGTDKANAASCNKCLLNWLREERHK